MFAALIRKVKPYKAPTEVVRANGTLRGFVLRASGRHQLYAGLLAVAVALLNFVPIELQRASSTSPSPTRTEGAAGAGRVYPAACRCTPA